MDKRTVRDIDVAGKRVLVRVDFNVEFDNGRISDDSRIRGALPTIEYLRERGAVVVLCSHLGRPGGKVVEEMRLAPVGDEAIGAAWSRGDMRGGVRRPGGGGCGGEFRDRATILLLENLRFHPEEEKNDPDFARALASVAEVFVQDGFGVSHRAHASTEGVTRYLPSVAGFLVESELAALGGLLESPARPLVASARRRKGERQDGCVGELHRASGLASGRRRHGGNLPEG